MIAAYAGSMLARCSQEAFSRAEKIKDSALAAVRSSKFDAVRSMMREAYEERGMRYLG